MGSELARSPSITKRMLHIKVKRQSAHQRLTCLAVSPARKLLWTCPDTVPREGNDDQHLTRRAATGQQDSRPDAARASGVWRDAGPQRDHASSAAAVGYRSADVCPGVQ